MTAPIWMAAPPEVHSALLSSGPGPGSLLAAAGAWNSLSAEYSSVADELTALLAHVQAGAWQGPSAESFVTANVPFLAWLTAASADSAVAAAQHETVAAAHAAALAAMPTLPELAINHVVHGALVATNFFGINTIPIALNEADYARMWIQAATTMATYDALSRSAVASTPETDPTPPILKSDSQTGSSGSLAQSSAASPDPIQDLLVQLLQDVGITWDPADGTIDGLPYASYTNPLTLLYWVKNLVTLYQSVEQFAELLATNPEAALASPTPANIVAFLVAHPVVAAAIAAGSATAAVPAASAAAAAVASVAGLVDTSAIQPAVPALVPIEAVPNVPVAITTPSAVATVASPGAAPAPASAPAASTAPASAPPPGPPPAGLHGFGFLYLVAIGGGPGIGFDSGASAGACVKLQAREPDAAAAAAAAATRRRTRKRRRQQVQQREYADGTMDLEIDLDPDAPTASDRGAGPLGFAGTVSKRSEQAAGLATLTGDDFGGGPSLPMLPHTWAPEAPQEEREGNPQPEFVPVMA
ncbi:PPE family protein [Mycobacterium sp.]|uniref:PPE family protein n=1 Tax=Mycobacterium sp. TaxID=1785 RepID=UPI003F991E58